MKAGRVSRAVRQWGNFTFLVFLLIFVGWYSYRKSLEKIIEIPEGHVQLVSETSGFLFFKSVHESVRRPGKYPLTPKELEQFERGEITCVPLGPRTFEVTGIVDTSSMVQGLSARIGMGHKTFADFTGTITIVTDESSIRKVVREDFPKTLQESFQYAANKASGLLKTKEGEKQDTSGESNAHPFSVEVEKRLQSELELDSISLTLTSNKEVGEGNVGVKVLPINGGATVPKIHEEMPFQGYLGIAFILFCTVFVYAIVRVFLGELFGVLFVLFIGVPLSAFGLIDLRLHQPGYYHNQRRRRVSSTANDIATGVAETVYNTGGMVGDAVSSVRQAHDGIDGVGAVGDAVSSLGDAADAIGGIGEAAGSIFDGLGALGDL
jgi:cation transport regulator ChaB